MHIICSIALNCSHQVPPAHPRTAINACAFPLVKRFSSLISLSHIPRNSVCAVRLPFPTVCATPQRRAGQTSGAVQGTRTRREFVRDGLSLGRLRGLPECPWLCLGRAMCSHGRGVFILIFPFAQPIQCPRGLEHFGASVSWKDFMWFFVNVTPHKLPA